MGEGQRPIASGSCLETPLLDAVPTWSPEERQIFSVFLLASSLSYEQVLLAGELLSQVVALPRSVFWGCGAFHDLQETLQGKATSAL